jgi:WD40 repeat protein
MANDTIELWDVATATCTRTIDGYEPDRGPRAAMDAGGQVAVRIVMGNKNRLVHPDLVFSPDGKTIAASLGNATVRQFDAASGKEVGATPGHVSGVTAVGSDGRTVVTVSKESVWVWNAGAGQLRHWALAPPAVAAVVSPDARRVATSSGKGVVQIWDTATGEKVRDIPTKRPDVAGIAFSPDGKVVATKAELNSAVNLWDAATGEHVRTIGQDGEPVFNGGRVMIDISGLQTPAIVFSPDGRLVAAAGDKKQLCVWDAASGTLVSEVPVPGRPVGVAFAFSADGQVLGLLLSNGAVAGYELATGEKRFETKPAPVPAGGLYPADVAGGASAVSTLTRGNPNAGAIAFTRDGRFILTAAGTPAVHVWDTLAGQEAAQLKGHGGSVSQLRIAADGRSLVSGSVDTTALVWDLTQLPRVDLMREAPLAAAELDALWTDLAKPDPAAAFTATRKLLTDRKQAVGLIAGRVRPVPAGEEAKVAQLVADLGGSFDARRKAAAELERLGEVAVPHLKKALDGNPSLDLKQRGEGLLQKAAVRKLQGDPLRELRAVELLELAATPEAKQALESLAKGAAGARLTREADAALARLGK